MKPVSILNIVFFLTVLTSFKTVEYHHMYTPDEEILVEEMSTLSDYKKNQYRKDATRLALRLQSDNRDFTELKAEVPTELVESIYQALVAVHLSDIKMAKEVTRVHKLHTFPIPSVDRFFVVYKRSAAWATPLRLGDTVTDNDRINELSEQYGLVIDKHVDWDNDHNSFNIRAKSSLNIAPIAKDFSEIEDVVLVDLLMPNGDGNDIAIKQLTNGWEISYMVKFESCITGCKKRHVWTFDVTNGKNVTFKGETGDELPAWMKKREESLSSRYRSKKAGK